MKKQSFIITGMSCAACQANITKRVRRLPGVESVEVSLLSGRMTAVYNPEAVDSAAIEAAVREIGYGISPMESPTERPDDFQKEWNRREQSVKDACHRLKTRLLLSIVGVVPLMYLSMGQMLGLPMPGFFSGIENALPNALTQFLIALAVAAINHSFFSSGYRALIKRAPNMDSLVSIGSSAALLYGLYAVYRMAYGLSQGDLTIAVRFSRELYFESSAMILTLVTLGKYLETLSKAKTSGALEKLMDLSPKEATVVRQGCEIRIPTERILPGEEIVIRPGERLPVDGLVLSGHGCLDQSAVTGESLPLDKTEGDPVLSGTVNTNGSFHMRATKVGSDTTLSQIIRLVDEAGNSKAPMARLADKVSGVFVPLVISIAALTIAVWLLLGESFEFAFSCGITVLVISCPCALGLATPVAIMVGTGRAAEMGILFKSAESLELLWRADTVVLDKTGTITMGKPQVTDIIPLDPDISQSQLLHAAASLESGSEHPLASAILQAARERAFTPPQAEGFTSYPGRGVSGTVLGNHWLAGNPAFLHEQSTYKESAALPEEYETLSNAGKTPLLLAREGKLAGIIAVADVIRPDSKAAVASLKKLNKHVVMLTGDHLATARAIAASVGIDDVVSDVLPGQKEACVRSYQENGHTVVMAGDGINDAPALTRADAGVAIGAGTDIALDSAQIVLMRDALTDLVSAMELSRAVISNIHMNLFWAFFYNALCIPVAAGVLYPALGIRLVPMLGAAAMSMSSLFVVGNALRLRRFHRKQSPSAGTNLTVKPISAEKKENRVMQKTMTIHGMMCQHCQKRVEKALSDIPGVQAVAVNLDSQTAVVSLSAPVENELLRKAVEDAGYDVMNIQSLDAKTL